MQKSGKEMETLYTGAASQDLNKSVRASTSFLRVLVQTEPEGLGP